MLAALNESKSIIECGTSFGVSTIYMALAVNRNVGGQRQKAFGVLTIEKDPDKTASAKRIWNEAGKDVEEWIDTRLGDLLEVLKQDDSLPETVDLVFLDGMNSFIVQQAPRNVLADLTSMDLARTTSTEAGLAEAAWWISCCGGQDD